MNKRLIVENTLMLLAAAVVFTFSHNLYACSELKLTYTYDLMRNMQADSQQITETCSRSSEMLYCYSELTQELNRTYQPLIADLPKSCQAIITGYASSSYNPHGSNTTQTDKRSEMVNEALESVKIASRSEQPALNRTPSFPW